MPKFQGTVAPITYSQNWTSERKEALFQSSVQAILKSMHEYKEHRQVAGKKALLTLASQPIDRIRP